MVRVCRWSCYAKPLRKCAGLVEVSELSMGWLILRPATNPAQEALLSQCDLAAQIPLHIDVAAGVRMVFTT